MMWEEFISLENIVRAWDDFVYGKRKKRDVQRFNSKLEDRLLSLHIALRCGTYTHQPYFQFVVNDPKRRIIHKANVQDRLVHRMIYNYLLEVYNKRWLDCSFSCRPGFGQHVSIHSVDRMLRQATQNYKRTAWAVKLDVKKFFDNIEHTLLYNLVCRRIEDQNIRGLIGKIIGSFHCRSNGVGVPIGNLTSQIFANVYLHECDLFVKHSLKIKYYARYADDCIAIFNDSSFVASYIKAMQQFFMENLKLEIHPRKISVRESWQGIDWLGAVLLPHYRTPRPSTMRRMMNHFDETLRENASQEFVQSMWGSYRGLLKDTEHTMIDQKLEQKIALWYPNLLY